MKRPVATALAALLLVSLAGVAHAGDPGWVNVCRFSHRLHHDPIVHPHMPGMSHSHDFYGNTSTDAWSTTHSLSQAGTTCELKADAAAYWMPTAYLHGRALIPVEVRFYYKTNLNNVAAVKPFPHGLRVIAGDHMARRPPDTSVLSWNCDHSSDTKHPSDCGSAHQVAHVKFPNCWDGVHLDSRDHMSHMTYPHDGRCPSSYPVPVPRLIVRVEWGIHDGRGLRFASGPYYTLHSDFVNTWDQAVLRKRVRNCINANVDCGHPDPDHSMRIPKGGNLAGNHGFEDGLGGWARDIGSRIVRVQGGHRSQHAAQVVARQDAKQCGIHDHPVWVGKTRPGRYRAEVWTRAAEPRRVAVTISELRGGRRVGHETGFVRADTSWRRLFADYVPRFPGDSRLQVRMWGPAPAGGGVCFRVDDISIVRALV